MSNYYQIRPMRYTKFLSNLSPCVKSRSFSKLKMFHAYEKNLPTLRNFSVRKHGNSLFSMENPLHAGKLASLMKMNPVGISKNEVV